MSCMKFCLVFLATILFISPFMLHYSFAEKGTFVDEVKFIQYLDENTALEEVRNGNLDIYFFRVSSDRIESDKAREGIQVFESTGGSYSMLVNPSISDKFNPFSITELRFALNYLIDRNLIVNELIGGYGNAMISNYGIFSADYLSIIEELESFHFKYNPALADEIISHELEGAGAEKIDGLWHYNGKQIEITFFIRSDDPVRKSIGEILSSELEKIGFKVNKDFGDLNKAFVVVYGSDPADQKWHLYTEGWGSSGFSKYDSVGLAQMYSPWFSNMPGNNDPTYWNYENDYIDSITKKIYVSDFKSSDERSSLIKQATKEGVTESVRIFLASKTDQYVANDNVDGVINALGAGVPTRFTAINAESDDNSLVVGVKQIYQGAWNPVSGFSDTYSNQIWLNIYDPGVFSHPFTGKTIPIRTDWHVENFGSDAKINVPDDAISWDIDTQRWENVGVGREATSKITFDLILGNWHHEQKMDMNDILYNMYFLQEWGSELHDGDGTYDSEYSPQAAQNAKTLVGIKQIDDDTVEVYVDYWHFDEAEIAAWATPWSSMPWEIVAASEDAVLDGKVSFSRSGGVSKSVSWLSLIVPNDANIIKEHLTEFKESKYIPSSLQDSEHDWQYFEGRYDAAIRWIDENKHAVISNGPFYLDNYSPESRTITINSFDSTGYPFDAGKWEKFEQIKFPKITNVEIPNVVDLKKPLSILVQTTDSSTIHYFISNPKGETVASGIKPVDNNSSEIALTEAETLRLVVGANTLKIFSSSDEALRPDVYDTSFLVVEGQTELPTIPISQTESSSEDTSYAGILSIIVGAIIVGIIVYIRRKRKTQASINVEN
ncbi:ABC transporter substrate-binding protein [Marine Group I thaumarchaeote]|uniref:ABC transporter substrate-binding protein n=1 Tax=Marine Group I thaumarchaeote TaxID=2511932 RepID=A0A7K4NSJ9_9ARCH|nr:ABC transporter substrate-binding protein [Marine Group I thaumarchaeote]